MIQTPKLPKSPSGSFFDDNWYFCADEVYEYFNVPKSAKAIKLRAYKEPGPGRLHVELWLPFGFGTVDFMDEIESEETSTLIVMRTTTSLKKLTKGHKNWYVECFYYV